MKPFSQVSITEEFTPIWYQCSKFLCKLSFTFACSLKCWSQNCENPFQNHQTNNENVTKKCTYLPKIMLHFLKFFHRAVASPVSNVGDWIWWAFQNRWVNVAYGVCRTDVIVLIWVSAVLPFHKCLCLLRLGL